LSYFFYPCPLDALCALSPKLCELVAQGLREFFAARWLSVILLPPRTFSLLALYARFHGSVTRYKTGKGRRALIPCPRSHPELIHSTREVAHLRARLELAAQAERTLRERTASAGAGWEAGRCPIRCLFPNLECLLEGYLSGPLAQGVFENVLRREGFEEELFVNSAGTSCWKVVSPPDERAAQRSAGLRGLDLSSQLFSGKFEGDEQTAYVRAPSSSRLWSVQVTASNELPDGVPA
jgi:hypothetical protein